MAVYERTYRSYDGELTDNRFRFLVLPRYAYQEVLKSKLFIGFLVSCFVWPLILAIIIYLPHNVSFLKTIQSQAGDLMTLFKYEESFFYRFFLLPYLEVSFIMAFIIGPALVSSDLRNNGLPLYLSRPFNRVEYILGKMAVLIILLSMVTWIPGLLLFSLQAYFAGWDWISDHARIAPAIFITSCMWILVLCLLSLALSAYVKWKPLARAAMFAVFFVLAAFGEMLNLMIGTEMGSLLNLSSMIQTVARSILGLPTIGGPGVLGALLSLSVTCGICLVLLNRKLRAYEVVS